MCELKFDLDRGGVKAEAYGLHYSRILAIEWIFGNISVIKEHTEQVCSVEGLMLET